MYSQSFELESYQINRTNFLEILSSEIIKYFWTLTADKLSVRIKWIPTCLFGGASVIYFHLTTETLSIVLTLQADTSSKRRLKAFWKPHLGLSFPVMVARKKVSYVEYRYFTRKKAGRRRIRRIVWTTKLRVCLLRWNLVQRLRYWRPTRRHAT